MRMTFRADQLDGDAGDGLELYVEGFPHDHAMAEGYGSQLYIEVYEGKLQIHIWDGTSDDPRTVVIEPKADPTDRFVDEHSARLQAETMRKYGSGL